jgi:hypothetical protein
LPKEEILPVVFEKRTEFFPSVAQTIVKAYSVLPKDAKDIPDTVVTEFCSTKENLWTRTRIVQLQRIAKSCEHIILRRVALL